jgi:lipopolysaccharide transport protein LptA
MCIPDLRVLREEIAMRVFKTSIALVLCFCISAFAEEKGFGKGIAEVLSQKLEVDHNKRLARFEGNVRAAYGDLSVHCDLMELTYNGKGEVVTLKAEGKVTVARGGARAKAKSARLDAKLGVLVLSGDPVLVQGENRLEGVRITIHLKGNRIDVSEARGTFKLGTETAK